MLIALCLVVAGPLAADYVYTGSLSSVNGGLIIGGKWNGTLTINWTVTDNLDGTYGYSYTFNSTGRAVSHFIAEVSPSFGLENIWDWGGETIIIDTWTAGPGNPNMPGPMYGIKFDYGGYNPVTYAFTSDRSPVWGDFYAKGANAYGWNVGFTDPDEDPLAPPDDGSLDFHLLVPDTTGPHDETDVPEPGSIVLGLCALGGALVGVVRRRRARR